jgi:hypothetical protein
MTTAQQNWAQRIQQARDNRIAAMATEAQIVRDAHAAGMKKTEIVAAYGRRNRQRIDALLNADPTAPQPPPNPPTIYLRGAGCNQSTWERVEKAMWARGWDTVKHRTSAWHLARGGCVVVLCDFSSADGQGLSVDTVLVGRVRAKYGETTERVSIIETLSTADMRRYSGRQWLEEMVEVTRTDMELPLVNGGEQCRPEVYDTEATNRLGQPGAVVLDVDALARMVAEVLEEQP